MGLIKKSYHASDEENLHKKGFKKSKIRTKNFKGFYFGASPRQVKRFGKHLYQVDIELDDKKTYHLEDKEYNENIKSGINSSSLKKKGYESVVVWDVDYGVEKFPYEIIVFDDERIKRIKKLR